MIQAELVRERGLLKSCVISGHAGAGPKGGDIVCAAVSVLARTAFRVFSERKGVTLRGGNPQRGEFWMEITSRLPENDEFLAGAGAFLEEGLLSIAQEYPDFCAVKIAD